MLLPCASQVTTFDNKTLGGDGHCKWNQTEVDIHIESNYYQIQAFYNEKIFDTAEYGDDKLKLTLQKHISQVNPRDSSYQILNIQKNEL